MGSGSSSCWLVWSSPAFSTARTGVVLDVAAFNERAIRLYRRLGFDKTGQHVETFDGYGAVEFIDMEKFDGEKPG